MNYMDLKYREPGDEVEISGVMECAACGKRMEGGPFGDDAAYISMVRDPLDPATDDLVHDRAEVLAEVTDEAVTFASSVAAEYLRRAAGDFDDRVDKYGEVVFTPDHSDYYGIPGDVEAGVPTESGGGVVVRWDQDGMVRSVAYQSPGEREW